MDRVVAVMTKHGIPCYDSFDTKTSYTVAKPPHFALSPEQEEIETELFKLADEKKAKIRASAANEPEVTRRWLKFMGSGGIGRLEDEAIRRIKARKRR